MGFSSFKTSDTQKSISNSYSSRGALPVHMITEDGQVFTEEEYEGYCDFGGKNVHVLIGEMNGITGKDEEDVRLKVIQLIYTTIITNGKRSYTAGGKDFFNWETPLKAEGGKTPNQLVAEGWKQEYPYGYGNFEACAKAGLKMPKFVETLPSKKDWKKSWDALPYPEDCEDQGYFYEEDEEEHFSLN
jgi:hypothetical protein